MLIEHTEEAIVSGRFPVVILFLGVASYLVCAVKLESEKRIDSLRGAKIFIKIVRRNEQKL